MPNPASVKRGRPPGRGLRLSQGLQAVARGDYTGAIARFQSAIDLDSGVVPAYLNLGDIYARDDKMAQAADVWGQVIDRAPDRAYLTIDRLSIAYEKIATPERSTALTMFSASESERSSVFSHITIFTARAAATAISA